MHIDSKFISWSVLGIGLFLYFWNVIDNEFTFATIFMVGSILLWLLIGLSTDTFKNNDFAIILSISGFLLALTVFFLFGLEQMPYPAGAIIFHSDGIAKALGLGLAASLPLLFGFENINPSPKSSSQIEQQVEINDDDYELADLDDLTSGEFDL